MFENQDEPNRGTTKVASGFNRKVDGESGASTQKVEGLLNLLNAAYK